MSTPLTDRINSLTSQANEVTGASDTTLSDAVATLISGYGQSGGTLDFLQELIFVNALGSADRQTVDVPQSWDKYDFLLFVPDLMITSQEGQTNGNWLWYGLRNGNGNTASNYDGISNSGKRTPGKYTVVVSKGYDELNVLYWYIGCWQSGRVAKLQATVDEKLSNLEIIYGTYYGGTFGYLNGTVEIYGGKF